MTQLTHRTWSIPADPDLDGSTALFADMGTSSVMRLLDANGWTLTETTPVQMLYRPGRQVMIRHAAWGVRSGMSRRFSVTTELRKRRQPAPAHEYATDDIPVSFIQESEHLRTWAYPFDPVLSGLTAVLSIDGARRLAEPLFGAECSVRSSIVRYRPTKRAVVRFEVRPRGRTDGEPMVLYVKVIPAESADVLMNVAAALGSASDRFVLPASRPEPDVVIYHNRAGTGLRDLLVGRDQPSLPAPAEILDVPAELQTLGPIGTPGPSSIERRLRSTVRLLAAVLPERSESLRALEGHLMDELDRTALEPITVHGDFYDGQLLVNGDRAVVGVLDIDDVGPADPLLDMATYSAHMVALSESHPEHVDRLEDHRDEVRDVFLEKGHDPMALAAREAVLALTMATGPLRVLSENWPERVAHRIDLATRLAGLPV